MACRFLCSTEISCRKRYRKQNPSLFDSSSPDNVFTSSERAQRVVSAEMRPENPQTIEDMFFIDQLHEVCLCVGQNQVVGRFLIDISQNITCDSESAVNLVTGALVAATETVH